MNSNLSNNNKNSSEENNSKKGNKLPVDKRIMWTGIAVIAVICFLVVFVIYSKFSGNKHTISKDLSPDKKDSTTLTREPAKKQDEDAPVPEPPENY